MARKGSINSIGRLEQRREKEILFWEVCNQQCIWSPHSGELVLASLKNNVLAGRSPFCVHLPASSFPLFSFYFFCPRASFLSLLEVTNCCISEKSSLCCPPSRGQHFKSSSWPLSWDWHWSAPLRLLYAYSPPSIFLLPSLSSRISPFSPSPSHLLHCPQLVDMAPKTSSPVMRRKFFETYARKKGFDPLIPENWYRQSRTEIRSAKVCFSSTFLFFSFLYISLLIYLYWSIVCRGQREYCGTISTV